MAQIKFTKSFPSVATQGRLTLMATLMRAGRPVASSCGGSGICGKCKVIVNAGWENLSPQKELEKGVLTRLKGDLSRERLSCQTRVEGDVEIDTPYW
jgi:2Fe-2S ferredoxin